MRPIQKNIYLPVQYFSVKILIYSATLTDFLNANLIIFLRDIKEKKVFYETTCKVRSNWFRSSHVPLVLALQ